MNMTMKPIGVFRCEANEKYEAPFQPSDLVGVSEGVICLNPHNNFEQALEDLEGFDKIWVLFLFDRNRGWKPKVLPPRGGQKRGVFATRSPHRPNPIGMSCVDLIRIKGNRLYVGSSDLLNDTPILDIKPYLPYADAFPEAAAGWVDELESESLYAVEWSQGAKEQAIWIFENGGPNLEEATACRLKLSPYPYPGRRVKLVEQGVWELSYKTWRIYYSLNEEKRRVAITHVSSGYTNKALMAGDDPWGDKQLHHLFINNKGE